MTSEEIKSLYHMQDVLQRYGLKPSRAGFLACPFHADKNPSLKVYEKDFHCYGCGAHGDIFDFVMQMEDVPFHDAFLILGGDCGKPSFSSRLAIYQSEKRRVMRQKEQHRLSEQHKLNNQLITIYQTYMERSEPFSDVWADCYNRLQYQLYIHAELNGLEARW